MPFYDSLQAIARRIEREYESSMKSEQVESVAFRQQITLVQELKRQHDALTHMENELQTELDGVRAEFSQIRKARGAGTGLSAHIDLKPKERQLYNRMRSLQDQLNDIRHKNMAVAESGRLALIELRRLKNEESRR